jgi:hypothetical protein
MRSLGRTSYVVAGSKYNSNSVSNKITLNQQFAPGYLGGNSGILLDGGKIISIFLSINGQIQITAVTCCKKDY